MESPCPFHPKGKHAAKDCYTLKKFVEEQANRPARDQDDPDRNRDQQQSGLEFSNIEHELHIIYGGSAMYKSKRKQKLTTQEINAVMLVTPRYLKWSEVAITFHRADHPDHIPYSGRYPLVLDPIVRSVKLNKVMIDGGSGLHR